jgi:putative beta-lysine N-acetyltransferase
MKRHVAYFGVTEGNRLIALSASEMDPAYKNAEMTDFATLPLRRGNGFGKHLLTFMEQALKVTSIKTAYTIARAASPGINVTFARCNYKYGGRLINNTNISGQIESMNIWYKSL